MKRMKLFVAGEMSGDPNDWDGLSSKTALLLAESEDEAVAMIEFTSVVKEVRMDQPAILSLSGYKGLV